MSDQTAIPSSPALEYARARGLHALVIAKDGDIVAEEYGEHTDRQTPHALYSGTKSFWGIAAIMATRDGILELDEPVAQTFTEWKADSWKRRVTLRELLSLTSGIGFGGLGASVPTYSKALDVQLRDEPGTTFTYGGIPLQIFGAVLARKLISQGLTPHDYLALRVLDPIGVHVARWRTLADGTHPLPTGAFLAAAEWLKFGLYVAAHRQDFAECFKGSSASPRYGLGFWLAPKGLPPDLVYASGARGQALYIVPSRETVVVHFGDSSSFKHEAFLKRLF